MRHAVGTALRLVRGSVLGVTWAFAALGAATGADAVTWAGLGWVLVTSTLFHVAVYVWNDLVDLPLDRTEPRRAGSPLVRGTVGVRQASLVAWTCAGGALAAASVSGTSAVLAMTAALALLGCYDLWGKRSRVPVGTDLLQGVGWGALVCLGAALTGGATTSTWWAAGYVTVLILLVNGVTGAARDLANDSRHGARTTALALGAHVDAHGQVRLTRALRLYGFGLQVLLVAITAAALAAAGARPTGSQVVAVVVLGAGGTAALVVALSPSAPVTVAWTAGLVHILAMVLLPFLGLSSPGTPLVVAVVILSTLPWLGSGWLRGQLRGRLRRSPWRRRAAVRT